jgi:hypothetical protein
MANIYLIWKGINDSTLYNCNAAGTGNLVNGYPTPNLGGTSSKPAIITLPDRMLLAWKGVGSDTGIWWSAWQFTGKNEQWNAQRNVPGVGTSWAPSLATWGNGDAVMAWNGVGSDTRIWMNKYNHTLDQAGKNPWGGQYLANMPTVGPIQSGSAPAIVNMNGKLLMVWRGEGDNDSLYYSISSDEGVTWVKDKQIPGAASSNAPAITMFNGRPFIAFKGGKQDTSIYSSIYTENNDQWLGISGHVGPFGTAFGPSLTVYNGLLFMTWKGIPGDNDLYWAQSGSGVPNTFTGQTVISNVGSSVGPAATVYSG